MIIRRIYLCCLSLFLAFQLKAQVWTLPENGWYGNISYTFFNYDQIFNDSGDIVDIPVAVNDQTIKLFAQYGITDKLTVQASVPYKVLSSELIDPAFNAVNGQYLESGSLNYFGNIELGALYKFYSGKPFITASFFVEANTTDRNYLTGLQTGFNSWGFRPGIGMGWALNKSWLQYYLGADFRTNNYTTAIISNVEYGFKPADYLYFAVNASLRNPVAESTQDCDCSTQYTALYLDQQQYIGIAFKGGFSIKNWGFNLAYNIGPASSNVAAAGVPSFGIQYKKE
jgi:hypothetical protein